MDGKKQMLKVITLFTGIGAQEAALKRLGLDFEMVGISEIDKYAIQSYEAINGPTRNYGNITQIEQLDYADLWTYSSPCQDFSTAGKQQGLTYADGSLTRSGLLLHVERLLVDSVIRGDNPKFLLMENVKGLVSKKFKADFDRWLEKLEQLGYNNYWGVLNAKDYGIPQNHERVFVVSIRKDVDDRGYKFPSTIPLKLKLKDMLETVVDKKYYLSDEKVERFLQFGKNKEVSNTLTSVQKDNKVIQIGNIVDTSNWDNPQRGRIYSPSGCSPALNTCGGGGLEPKIVIGSTQKNAYIGSYENYSPCLTSAMGMGGGQIPMLSDNIRIRKLTPRECWRLMGFTDIEFESAQLSGISNTQLYKQAGNSIVVNVLVAIFKELFNDRP